MAIFDIMHGIHDLAALASAPRGGQRGKPVPRKQAADRIQVTVDGIRSYLKQHMRHVGAFICCVDATSSTKHATAHRLSAEIKKECEDMIVLVDELMALLKRKDVPPEQIRQYAARTLEMLQKEFPDVGKKAWDLEAILQEAATEAINISTISKDEFVSRLAKIAAKKPDKTPLDDLR